MKKISKEMNLKILNMDKNKKLREIAKELAISRRDIIEILSKFQVSRSSSGRLRCGSSRMWQKKVVKKITQ